MSIKKYQVSNNPNVYEAWPDLVLTDGGKLICIYNECENHTNRSFTNITLIESNDRGRTWVNKRYLVRTKGIPYWNCPRISKLKDGNLIAVCDKLITPEFGKTKRIRAINYLWISDDEGATWTEPIETPVEGIVPDKICELASGRWLLTAHQKNEISGYLEQRLWYSDNKGNSWNGPIIIASEKDLNLCEATLLPLSNGDIVAFLRENSGMGMDCYKAISKDSGESWQGVYRVPIPGCHRPVAGKLNSGKILVSYRFHHGKGYSGGMWFMNFFAALMDEKSAQTTERKEQVTRIMPIDYDKNPSPDCGYSGWVQFEDGEIYIVQYIKDNAEKAQIRGYSLTEDEFCC